MAKISSTGEKKKTGDILKAKGEGNKSRLHRLKSQSRRGTLKHRKKKRKNTTNERGLEKKGENVEKKFLKRGGGSKFPVEEGGKRFDSKKKRRQR